MAAEDFNRTPEPAMDLGKAISQQTMLWMALAQEASNIAHAKRTMFSALVAEGFTEPQAIDLIKGFS